MLVLNKAQRPEKSFFNKEDIVLLYVEKRSSCYYDIRGGIVLNPLSHNGKEEALEIKVLQILTRKNALFYNIPELPFVYRYPYYLIRRAEKFANLESLSEQISRLNKLINT